MELAPGLFGVSIDAEAATEEYLAGQLKVRPLVEILTRSKAFHTFAAAAPGLPELVTIGKIWSLAIALDDAGRPLWDVVIVDCPATGHGIALLDDRRQRRGAGRPAARSATRPRASTRWSPTRRPPASRSSPCPRSSPSARRSRPPRTLRGQGLPVAAAVLNVRAVAALLAPTTRPPSRPRWATDRARSARPRGPRSSTSSHQEADVAYRERLAAETGLPVLELPEVITRRFDLTALGVLADARGRRRRHGGVAR